jgi:hypothetical protein
MSLLAVFLVACSPPGEVGPSSSPCSSATDGSETSPPTSPGTTPSTPGQQVDTFVAALNPTLDVAWMVDGSHSMSCQAGCHSSVAEDVALGFGAFVDVIDALGVDWRVGVLTNDMEDPAVAGLLIGPHLDATTADPEAAFAAQVEQVGILRSVEERGFDALLLSLNQNPEFYRADSAISAVVVSNEDDLSEVSTPEFLDAFSAVRPDPSARRLHALVCTALTPTDDTVCSSDRVSVGAAYLDAADALGGGAWDLLSPDWDEALGELGDAVAGAEQVYPLSSAPLVDSLAVEIEALDGDVEVLTRRDGTCGGAGEFVYSAATNAVTLCASPPVGAVVRARYTPAD